MDINKRKIAILFCVFSFLFIANISLSQTDTSSEITVLKIRSIVDSEKQAIKILQEKISGWEFIISEIDQIISSVNALEKESISQQIAKLEESIVISDQATKEDVFKQLKRVEKISQNIFNRVNIRQIERSFWRALENRWGSEINKIPFIDYMNFIYSLRDHGDINLYIEPYFTYDNFRNCTFYSYEVDQTTKPTECLDTLNLFISDFDKYKNGLVEYFGEQRAQANDRKTAIAEEVKRRQEDVLASEEELKRHKALEEAQAKARTIIDPSAERLILYTLIAWAVIIVVAVTGVLIVTHWRTKTSTDPLEFSFALFLQIVTVFLLTATILILGIAGKIDAEALAALIGGISGYVLGRLSTATGKKDNQSI